MIAMLKNLLADEMIKNHVLKEKLVVAGKKIGEMVRQNNDQAKEIKALRKQVESAPVSQ